MPTFSAVALPVPYSTNASSYVVSYPTGWIKSKMPGYSPAQDIGDPHPTDRTDDRWDESGKQTSTDPANIHVWKNYSGLDTVTDNTNQCAVVYADFSASWPYVGMSPPHDRYSGRAPWKLRFPITGWEDLPEYIVPKGIQCTVHYAVHANPGPSTVCEMTLERENSPTTATKTWYLPSPWSSYITNSFVDGTMGTSTDKWFTTLSSEDVRGDLYVTLQRNNQYGPSSPSGPAGYLYLDKVSFVLYFSTDWYYGIVGTPKGMQNKLNGISLATVAGVNGMSREA